MMNFRYIIVRVFYAMTFAMSLPLSKYLNVHVPFFSFFFPVRTPSPILCCASSMFSWLLLVGALIVTLEVRIKQ